MTMTPEIMDLMGLSITLAILGLWIVAAGATRRINKGEKLWPYLIGWLPVLLFLSGEKIGNKLLNKQQEVPTKKKEEVKEETSLPLSQTVFITLTTDQLNMLMSRYVAPPVNQPAVETKQPVETKQAPVKKQAVENIPSKDDLPE